MTLSTLQEKDPSNHVYYLGDNGMVTSDSLKDLGLLTLSNGTSTVLKQSTRPMQC